MKRIAAVLMLAALSWAAQDNKNAQTKPPAVSDEQVNRMVEERLAKRAASVEKLFVLKYADPGPVMALVRALGGQGNENIQMRAIAVTAEKGAMAVIEDAVKQLDVPSAAPKNIELTVNLIMGSDAESGLGNPVPKELESVVTQLKGAFPFKNYRQVDLIELRSRTGELAAANSESGATGPGPGTVVLTHFMIRRVGLAQDGSTVRLDGMEASIRWPDLGHPLNLNASVDVKEGEKVVVGRIGVSHDQALFVVLTAHVVQ
ncbi:MAG: hypothetical protein WCB12_17235 [Bryobacteraceae bacterium]